MIHISHEDQQAMIKRGYMFDAALGTLWSVRRDMQPNALWELLLQLKDAPSEEGRLARLAVEAVLHFELVKHRRVTRAHLHGSVKPLC